MACWLVLFALSSLSTHGQISPETQSELLDLLARARSERQLIERSYSAVVDELTALKENSRQQQNEYELQKSLWGEQNDSLQTRIEDLEAQRVEQEKDLQLADARVKSLEDLIASSESYRQAAEAEARKQRRGKWTAIIVAILEAIALAFAAAR